MQKQHFKQLTGRALAGPGTGSIRGRCTCWSLGGRSRGHPRRGLRARYLGALPVGGRLRHDVALGPSAAAVGVGGADIKGRLGARDRGGRADGAAVGRCAGWSCAGLAGVGAGCAGVALGRGGFDRRGSGRSRDWSGSRWAGHRRGRRRRRSRDRRRRGRRGLLVVASAASAAGQMTMLLLLFMQKIQIISGGVVMGHFHGSSGGSRVDEAQAGKSEMTAAAGGGRRRRSQGQKGQEADVDRAGEAVEPTGAAREGRCRRRRRRGGGHGWSGFGMIGEKDRCQVNESDRIGGCGTNEGVCRPTIGRRKSKVAAKGRYSKDSQAASSADPTKRMRV